MTKKAFEMEKSIYETWIEMLRIDYKGSLHLDILLLVLLFIAIACNVVAAIYTDKIGVKVWNVCLLVVNLTNLIFCVRRRIKARKLYKDGERVFRERLQELDELIGECVVCDR